MAIKQLLKRSEARILIYLDKTRPELCTSRVMSLKLDIARNYIYDLLSLLQYKGLIHNDLRKYFPKRVYKLTLKGLNTLDLARKVLIQYQRKLR